jgi:hypothetical protein
VAETGVIPVCRCGVAPEAFVSDTTGEYILVCRNPDCEFLDTARAETAAEAVLAWSRLVKTKDRLKK